MLSFEFRHGWCSLRLDADGRRYTTRATTLVNSFEFLLDALIDIAEGANCASAIWAGEASGTFIDLAVATHETVAVVVHGMKYPDYVTADAGWMPVRGRDEFALAVPFGRLWPGLAGELDRIRREYADDSGHMPHWGWPFPMLQFRRIEELAVRFGHEAE